MTTMLELAERLQKAIVVSLMEQHKTPGPLWAMPLSDDEQASIVAALRQAAPGGGDVLATPIAWLVDSPFPLTSSELYLSHDKALAAFNDWGKRITPLFAAPAQAQESLQGDILSIIYNYRDLQPEEDESWESWYYAAFDLACMKVRERFKKPAPPLPAQPQAALSTIERVIVDYFEQVGCDVSSSNDGSNEWELDLLERDDVISLTALAVAISAALSPTKPGATSK